MSRFPPEWMTLPNGARALRCTARRRRTSERCRLPAIRGRQVCRLHGGRAPVGPAASNWRHGLYSSVLPTNFREAFRRMRGDPALLSLADDVAALTAAIEVKARTLGPDPDAKWMELLALVERRARLVALESKRLADSAGMVSATRVVELAHLLLGVIARHVADRNACIAIATEFQQLLNAERDEQVH
jgi:hypothetical protein